MCTSCLLISALLMFTPAENGVQPNYPNQVSLAQETQVAITEMIEQLPNSQDMSLLRTGLSALHSRLATAKNDVQAQNMIDNEMISLSQRLSNAPSAEKVTEILEDMLIEDDDQLLKSLSYAPTKSKSKGMHWGWLR